MHLVSTTFHSPSGVLFSLACSFRGSDERYLVVSKTNSLQIFILQPHGTELVCEKEIWGIPKGLGQLSSSKHLVIGLDIPQARVIVLDFNPETSTLVAHHTSVISPLAHRPSNSFSGLLINKQTVCATFYNGHVKSLNVGSKEPYEVKESDLRVHELTIRTMCFTLPVSDSTLAIVYTDHHGRGRLIGRMASTMNPSPQIPDKELENIPDLIIPVVIEDSSADKTYGVLLVAPRLVTFVKTNVNMYSDEALEQSGKGKSKAKASRSKSEVKAAIQASVVTVDVPFEGVAAWTQLDGTHLVVGDWFGRMYLLTLSMEPQFTMGVIVLGEVSVPSTLAYLSHNILYVGSFSAPCQLVQISENVAEANPGTQGKKKYPGDGVGNLEIMATHDNNIAPMMDATLVDADGSGQLRIATISGDDSGGSLNIMHKGASFRELAVLDGLSDIDSLFPLRKYYDAVETAFLVITTVTTTYFFSVSEAGLTLVTPGEFTGISRTARTILVTNILLPGTDAVLHVTPNGAAIVDLVTGAGIGSWNPPKGDITAAAVDPSTCVACVATSDGMLHCLSIQPAGIVKASTHSFRSKVHSQISALSVSGHAALVSFWGSNETLSMSLPNLQVLESKPLIESSAASSVLLSNLGGNQLYAFLARIDGLFVTYAVSPTGVPVLGSRRAIPLGGAPIHLSFVPAHGSSSARIIAAGKRAAVLSISNGRLATSTLPITDVCALSVVDSPGIGRSIVYATSTGLVFGQIEQLDKLNITSFKLGNDNPVRLAYHPGLSTFVVGCVRTASDSDDDEHSVRFIDDSTFQDLGRFELKYSEMPTSVAPYVYSELSCVLVGTAIFRPGESEPRTGRIITFKVDPGTGIFKMESAKTVEGGVSSIKQLKQRIVACISYGVYVFDLAQEGLNISEPIAKWERGYQMDDVVIRGDMIVVSDKLRSVSVLRLVREVVNTSDDDETMDTDDQNSPVRFETVAMDMHAIWPTSIEILDDDKTIIAAQVDGNILTWEVDDDKLEPRAAYYIGETINRFITLPPRTSSGSRPVMLFVTNAGRIGTLSTIESDDALQLTRLELKMDNAFKGLGDVNHADWRAPKRLSSSVKPPPRRGVTDGDFVKKFLELNEATSKQVLTEGSAAESISTAEEEQIRRCLEGLSTDQ